MADFSVVVISYNGRDFLSRCLNRVSRSTIKPLKTIVVDDYSGDGTEKMIDKEFKWVEFIKNEKNFGPTVSRNRGAQLAKGEYVIFLDNDVLIKPETFSRMVDFMEGRRDAGVAGAKLIPAGGGKMWFNAGYDPNNFRETVGYIIGFLLKIFPWSRRLKNFSLKFILNYWDYDRTLSVGWVIEGCFIIRREIFEKINGFDEDFFMYYEGPDLCRRVRQEGFKIYFYPEATADILDGHTHTKAERSLYLVKLKYLFYKKHYFYKKSNPVMFFAGKTISGIFYLFA